MKIWKIITVLLAVLLLAGCVGGATISSITVSLDAPATGEKVKSATTSTSGVKVTSTTWSPVATDTFDASQTYTATIVLEPSSSSDNFASSVTVKLNGNSKTYTSSDNGKKVTVQHTFSKTVAATTISEIKCNLEKPLAANTPATTVSFTKPTSGLKSTVTWDTTDKKFVLGKKYKSYLLTLLNPIQEK
jgi:gas vesicle protein